VALTVTATEGANAVNGILLRVKVLTGAAARASQTGAVKTADTTLTPFSDQSITTTVTGSVVYGAMANGVTNTSFTPDARTTFIDQIPDGVQVCEYASWKATAATGAPGATVLGATAPTNDHGTYAAAEILAAGTIAEDGSGPAAASSTGATAVTTASFTPPAGSLLVAIVAHCSSAASSITISNSGVALTWTQRAYLSTTAGTGSGVWIADAPAASASVPSRATRTAVRAPAVPSARRYRQMLPVPAQLNPPYQFTELAQRRETWPRSVPRRSHISLVVPPQVNPPYPTAEIRQGRQPRGFFPRRGHGFTLVPAQQSAAVNPAFTFQQPKHLRMVYLRRGRVVTPVPAQQTAPVAVFVPQAQRHARLMAAPRRGKVTTAAHLAHEVPRLRTPQRRRIVPVRRGRTVTPVPAQVTVANPAQVQGHRGPVRAIALFRRRFRQLMPWPQAVAPAFSIGTLTATGAATTALTAASGSNALTTTTAPAATLTASDQRTGGPA
jgi:hypothetical protein